MGEVSEAVKGSGPKPSSKTATEGGGNLRDQVKRIADEVSRLTSIKDGDAASEGEAERPENVRKAGLLRAAHSLLRSAANLLEDY